MGALGMHLVNRPKTAEPVSNMTVKVWIGVPKICREHINKRRRIEYDSEGLDWGAYRDVCQVSSYVVYMSRTPLTLSTVPTKMFVKSVDIHFL